MGKSEEKESKLSTIDIGAILESVLGPEEAEGVEIPETLLDDLDGTIRKWVRDNRYLLTDQRFCLGEAAVDAALEAVDSEIGRSADESLPGQRVWVKLNCDGDSIQAQWSRLSCALNDLPEWYEDAYALYVNGTSRDRLAMMTPQSVVDAYDRNRELYEWLSLSEECPW